MSFILWRSSCKYNRLCTILTATLENDTARGYTDYEWHVNVIFGFCETDPNETQRVSHYTWSHINFINHHQFIHVAKIVFIFCSDVMMSWDGDNDILFLLPGYHLLSNITHVTYRLPYRYAKNSGGLNMKKFSENLKIHNKSLKKIKLVW